MNPESLLAAGERGTHVLFETETIAAAFEQDARLLRRAMDVRGGEFQHAVKAVLEQPDGDRARAFIRTLPAEFQYVLVLLYFDLLDGRLRRDPIVH